MINWIRSQQIVIIFTCLVIICVSIPVMLYANANLPELVRRNADDGGMLMLLVEMQHEAGLDYIEAKKDYEYLLVKFREYMEERNCSLLLRVLYPELSPRKQLTLALAELSEPIDGQEQAQEKINEATETIRQFVSKSQEFAGTKVSISELHDCPDELLNEAKSALDDSRKYVEIFGNNPNIPNSQETCRKNRVAIALAYLIRCVLQDFDSLDDELRQFRGDINRTIYYNKILMKNNADLLASEQLPDVRKKELEKENALLEKYTANGHRRLVIVNALLDKDIHITEDFLRNKVKINE